MLTEPRYTKAGGRESTIARRVCRHASIHVSYPNRDYFFLYVGTHSPLTTHGCDALRKHLIAKIPQNMQNPKSDKTICDFTTLQRSTTKLTRNQNAYVKTGPINTRSANLLFDEDTSTKKHFGGTWARSQTIAKLLHSTNLCLTP